MTHTSQRTEHGYVTPDGVTHWQGYNPTDPLAKQHDLTTVRGQGQTTAAFRQQLAHAGVTADDFELKFVQRVITTEISETIPLLPAPEDIQNGCNDDLDEF